MHTKTLQDILIVGTKEELNQTNQQQHKKWQKWDLLICNNFKAEPKNSNQVKQSAVVER